MIKCFQEKNSAIKKFNYFQIKPTIIVGRGGKFGSIIKMILFQILIGDIESLTIILN
jgi:hypothetical protein